MRAMVSTALVALSFSARSHLAQAQTYDLLYTFTGGADGRAPAGRLLLSGALLYGTAEVGGEFEDGVVHSFNRETQSETVLYSFTGGADGSTPQYEAPVMDGSGNLYGTTYHAGSGDAGTVFRLAPDGNLTTLHGFAGGSDGANPAGGLLLYEGVLFGTTRFGGSSGSGTIFAVNASTGNTTILCTFTGGADGHQPYATLVTDGKGNLFGTTSGNFTGGAPGGTIFELNLLTKVFTTIYTFTGGAVGQIPLEGVTRDSSGNLYGANTAAGAFATGTLYKFEPSGTLVVLHAFSREDGNPICRLILDAQGNLYGTTTGISGSGAVVFELNTHNDFTVLYTFTGYTGAGAGAAGVTRDAQGQLYGTTTHGGEFDAGRIIRITP